ncbi:MAG: hypothetical protein OQK82_09100 [Candidatus Pacearchaeota archaeon]|nr:hypothetical protein [Candidatus Pacearchaeota archaeon]
MSMSHLHEFHFVLERTMKENLMLLELYKKTRSFSGVIVQILSLLSPVLKKKHIWGKQRKSRYLNISPYSDEIREHVHVYFPGEVYRELKLLHQDLNYYSIAQLVREFLRLFLFLVKKFGSRVFRGLKNLYKHWEDEQIRLTPQKFVRQLWKILQHSSGKNRLLTIYNQEFSPFWVFRL